MAPDNPTLSFTEESPTNGYLRSSRFHEWGFKCDDNIILSTEKGWNQSKESSNEIESLKKINSKKLEVDDIPLDDDWEMPALTFRCIFVGFFISSTAAVIQQFFLFKPNRSQVQPLFLQLACLFLGRGLASIPGPKWWNPGPFTLKENVLSSIMSTAAAVGTLAVKMIATQELYEERSLHFATAMAIMLSSQLIGYGFAGVLRGPFVYARQAVFPAVLPSVALFRSFHDQSARAEDQMDFFRKTFLLVSLYEILPQYLAPTLQAVSPFCLKWQNSEFVSRQFGGALSHEGLGMVNFSLEWNSISSLGPLYTPFSAQVNQWFGVLLGYFLYNAAWENSWWNGGRHNDFPFLNSQLFTQGGELYNTTSILKEDGTGDWKTIENTGAPYFASSFVLAMIATNLAVGAALSHCLLWGWAEVSTRIFFGKNESESGADPHHIICRRYPEIPLWIYIAMTFFATSVAFLASSFTESGLPPLGLAAALILAGVLVIASAHLKATTGAGLEVESAIQMLGGMLFPNDAYGNMWFTTYGSATVSQSISMLQDLKLGQYMHLSPRSVFVCQLLGTCVGVIFNYMVMTLVVDTNKEILLSDFGSQVFTGVILEDFHSQAISWGLFTRELFTAGRRYFIVPLSLVFGLLLPLPFFLLHKVFPSSKMESVNTPLICGALAILISRANAGFTLSVIVGFLSQYYAKKYRPEWFHKSNYVLSAALDGGAQVTAVLLGFIVEGGAGWKRIDFPQYFLNPASYPYISRAPDYCLLSEK